MGSPLKTPRLLPLVVAVAGAALIAGLVSRDMNLLGDGFWYIASGRWLLEHRALPHADPFSYASVGERWVIGMPGACVLFALVADHAGLRALLLLGTFVETAALVALWLGAARTTGARLLLLPVLALVVAVGADDLSVRGQVFGDVGFVALLAALRRLRDGERVPWWSIVLGAALWANLHYSYLLLFFVPIAAVLLFLLEPPPDRPPFAPFFAVPALALVGACLNPYGPRYLPFTVRMLFTPIADQFTFYQSPDFHAALWIVPTALALAVVVARGRWGDERARIAESLFLVLFLVAACNSRRWETLLLMVAIGMAGPLLDRAAWPGRVTTLATVALGATAVAIVARAVAHPLDPLGDVPVAAAQVARDAQRARAEAGKATDRVIDPLHWGGYLAYAWNGDPKYFHDGRDQILLFDNGVYEDARALWHGEADALEVLDVYEGGVVLWERGSPLDQRLRESPGWVRVHEDAMAVVYVRER